jgi:hypothetical protein
MFIDLKLVVMWANGTSFLFCQKMIDIMHPGQRHLWCDDSIDFGLQFLDFRNRIQHSVGTGL